MTALSTVVSEALPLADYLTCVLTQIRPLPAREVEVSQAYGQVVAEEIRAPAPLPPFDHATVDGYAARADDLAGAAVGRSVRLNVVGDLTASTWRPVRLATGTCVSVAAGAPLPAAADLVVPPSATDQGMAAVEIHSTTRRGNGVRRTGGEVPGGAGLATAGTYVTPALLGLLASTGVGHVRVRARPRVAIVATGDELIEAGRVSQPGQVVDANSPALAAAAVEAGGQAYRASICADDPERLRAALDELAGRADLVVTTGGTGHGPGDMARRGLGRDGPVAFREVSVFPCSALGFGLMTRPGPARGAAVPVICLPGDPGSALIGFEVLARPVIQMLAGGEPSFRPSVRAHLLETIASPVGRREFRPARVSERRGGGYTVAPLAGGPYTLSGLAVANGLIVLGEKVGQAAAGSTVDVLLLDRRC
ncbi:MAG: gephyrin-like molybdotransferase Glp [Micromonosporaceae bacterium]